MNKIKIGLQLFLGGMFLLSAYSKLIAPGIFEILLIENGIFDNRQMAGLFTTILIGSELAIGFLLFQPNYLKKIIIPVTILILSIFTVHLVYSGFVLGDSENCGCFGELIQLSSIESSIKNIIVIIAALFFYRLVRTDKNNFIPPLIILITSFIIAFTFAPIRDINSFQFKDYTYFEGRGRIDLTSNEILLAVFNLDCDHCKEAATTIGEMKLKNKNIPETLVLFYKEDNATVDSFNTATNTFFPYRFINADEFFNLIGNSPPRIYWLNGGEIIEFWDDNFKVNLENNFGE